MRGPDISMFLLLLALSTAFLSLTPLSLLKLDFKLLFIHWHLSLSVLSGVSCTSMTVYANHLLACILLISYLSPFFVSIHSVLFK